MIQRRIISGEMVYFESPLEELAFKYIPDKHDIFGGKYFAKCYCHDEYEVNPDSSSVDLAINEGTRISKNRYDRYHMIKGDHWNKQLKTPYKRKSVGA